MLILKILKLCLHVSHHCRDVAWRVSPYGASSKGRCVLLRRLRVKPAMTSGNAMTRGNAKTSETWRLYIPLGMCLSVETMMTGGNLHSVRNVSLPKDASLTGCGALRGGNDFLPRDASLTGCRPPQRYKKIFKKSVYISSISLIRVSPMQGIVEN